MKKKLNVGHVIPSECGFGCVARPGRAVVEIEIRDENKGQVLSIWGEIGSGLDLYTYGQINSMLRELLAAGHLYSAPKYLPELLNIWDRWHLNNMRAGCEHQRANWGDMERKVTLYTYRLTGDTFLKRRKVEDSAMKELARGESVQLKQPEQWLLSLEWELVRPELLAEDSPLFPRYKLEKSEEKAVGWIRPTEHPEGLLGKPCEVCGYGYGSAWLYEPLPPEVVSFLETL